MSTAIVKPCVVAAALCLLVAALPVRAEDAAAAKIDVGTTASALGGRAVAPQALARQRGGSDAGSLSDLKLNGVVNDNRAANLTTGNNVISDGALAGVSGVPLVVQNSGNNVLIQSATIINVTVR